MTAPHIIVDVQVLRPGAKLPEYKSDGAAGMDLYALTDDVRISDSVYRLSSDDRGCCDFDLCTGGRVLVPTGIALAISQGWEGQIRPRSGLALRDGLTVLNTPGTIDSDYRGEVKVLLVNLGSEPVTIRRGDRIAQIVFCPVARATLRRVDVMPATGRGEGGFGSSGRRDTSE